MSDPYVGRGLICSPCRAKVKNNLMRYVYTPRHPQPVQYGVECIYCGGLIKPASDQCSNCDTVAPGHSIRINVFGQCVRCLKDIVRENPMYGTNKIAEALEEFLKPSRIPWAGVVVGLAAAYFLTHFLPWAARGFPVLGQ